MRIKTVMAAIVGGIFWAFGATGVVLGELDYRGLTENPIPDPVSFGVTAVGSILLLIALVNIRRAHIALGATAGAPGYWIAIAGLVLLLFPAWPFFVIGPMVLALGVTIYAVAALSAAKTRSFGLWLHALNIPVGMAVGFSFAGAGYDGGIGIVTSLVMVIMGFMSLAYDAAGLRGDPVGAASAEPVEATA